MFLEGIKRDQLHEVGWHVCQRCIYKPAKGLMINLFQENCTRFSTTNYFPKKAPL